MTVLSPESPEQALIRQVHQDGYGILHDALTADEVAGINAEAVRLCRGIAGAADGESDAEVLRRHLCLHHPHKTSALIRRSLAHHRILDVLTRVIGPNVKAMQSMLFVKAEGKPGQPWHQDEFFIPTRDRSLTAVWIALDDATVENGCLWVLPGSHRRGVLYPDREQDDPRFDCSIEAYGFPHRDEDAVPVEVPAGSAVIFNGYLLHRSLPNSGRHGFRRALVHHYMSAESPLCWKVPPGTAAANWDYRDIVLVAGEDPYAYKGITDTTHTYLRPDKDGGCDR
ncbi:protein involved in biosynthesis of mitomycin antibiotics/polyketide fumonisin [Amycolatopsis deserti]|uniref:Protein involved in biosynthesis of mitomycin antibiotics/polyketide fumonisin n=1 Tax=Amycolatopsis deserti TaxID=185696 RepID=A0ABQ3ICL4_9PSEU|nr:phytanoyl-CoA dioxygenase family protein [Amycolatopsis deserti]GHE79305.1 protein involved in biosynthesis of mitomycin antibiotics/polyketide fumonisin [Amycolatopsis deserti]